jgi:hypothetical protein
MALPTTEAADACAVTGEDTWQDVAEATAVTIPAGNVRVILPLLGESASAIAVTVVKDTASALDAPGALPVMDKALEAVAATHPVQAVLTYVGAVSTDVSILRPFVGFDGVGSSAANGARVNPVHVIVTGPAATVAVGARVNVILFV